MGGGAIARILSSVMTMKKSGILAACVLATIVFGPVMAADSAESNSATKGDSGSFLSQFRDPQDGKFDVSQWLLENIVGFMPVPIIITQPAVDNGLGLAGIIFHKPRGDQMKRGPDGELILPNITAVGAAYTGNDSWMVGGGHFRNWDGDRYRYNIAGGYADMNLDWYGSPDFPLPVQGVGFNIKGAMLQNEFFARLGKSSWYLGAAWLYLDSEVQFQTSLPIELPVVQNAVSGLSAIGLYQDIDYRLSPRKGFTTELTLTSYGSAIGSDYDFEQFAWLIRQYLQFGDKYTLAWRFDGAVTSGDVPFYMEPFIQMEGIPALRYQGRTAATAELRAGYDLTPRWTIKAFVGAGRVADSFADLASASSETAYGAGIRYLIARALGLRVGIDVARGSEGTYVYLVMGSAWNTGGF